MNKDFVKNIPIVWLLLIGVLVGIFSYTVGSVRSADQQAPQILIVYPPESTVQEVITEAPEPDQVSDGQVMASKNGTKYYPVGCSGSSRILPENRVWYASPEDAQDAGLELSKTCDK